MNSFSMKNLRNAFFIVLFFGSSTTLFAQGRPYEGPDDPASDLAAERSGFMIGNRVLLFFRNTTELGDCCGLGYDVSKWPNNFEGTKMHDGIATIIGARVYLENDSIPVTEPSEIASRNDLDTLFYMQSSYREFMDDDPTGTVEWALYPVPGYFNELSETPAMSNRPDSWPPQGWPAREEGLKWPGEWNGRFGRGVIKADQESFLVANDSQDQEYLQPDSPIKYFPRPGVNIGDKKPDITVQNGAPWGGIGVRIEQRGFQWSNPSATDAIFWEYNISNTSDYDLPEVVFAYLLDNAVGGEEGLGDDIAFYNRDLNMTFSWDVDFIPVGGGREPGVLGFAFLESPGLAFDNVDNDNDGLTDEKRDNQAQVFVGPTDGITDLNAFLDFYNLTEADLKPHWDADEDQDWNDGVDANGDGIYQAEEDAGDDVGLDGVGPNDLNYFGPDADGTEGNHKPDFLEGLGSEPNFAATDINESDMLGLTTFRYLLQWGTCVGFVMCNDELSFDYVTSGIFDDFQGIPRNFIEYFASGLFPLFKGRTERISMSELHSYDPLAGLNSAQHTAPSLFRLKEVVQIIYESDYRFAQPPLMPTLKAVPGDGQVFLVWDNVSDTKTRDPFLKNANDFEGYKLYRATDKKISDPELITDGFGNPLLRRPIFQCDLINNITGFADFGEVNGVEYYLGSDSGIEHFFIDNTVQNGRTYYYVLVAYDRGIPEVSVGITPSENNFVLEVDEADQIVNVSKNVAVVQPEKPAAGYVPPNIDMPEPDIFSTASITPRVVVPELAKQGHTYKVKFEVQELGNIVNIRTTRHPADLLYANSGIFVYDVTAGDSLVYFESGYTNPYASNFSLLRYVSPLNRPKTLQHFNVRGAQTRLFDGLMIDVNIPHIVTTIDSLNTGWVRGNSPLKIEYHPGLVTYLPGNYEIVFGTEENTYDFIIKTGVRDIENNLVRTSNVLDELTFDFAVINKDFTDESGNFLRLSMIGIDIDEDGAFDRSKDVILAGYETTSRNRNRWAGTVFQFDFRDIADDSQLPQPGDTWQMKFFRPFSPADSIMFTIDLEEEVSAATIAEDMDMIKVVPNPYVATNLMEEAVTNPQLSQRRKLAFTHIPAQCTIRIFTVSGALVDVLEVSNAVESRATNWDNNTHRNGMAYWDLKTKEGLDIPAGYYIYHVESHATGEVKIGKFAVLK